MVLTPRADSLSLELPPDWVVTACWRGLLCLTVLVVGWAVVRLVVRRRLAQAAAAAAIGAACLATTGSLWLANTHIGLGRRPHGDTTASDVAAPDHAPVE